MIKIQNVTVRFGGVVALDEIDTTFSSAVSGIIGPNGAGKTTLMNVISGFVYAQNGQIVKDEQNLMNLAPFRRAQWGLRRSFQKEEIADDLTVAENILVQVDHSTQSARQKRQDVAHVLKLVGMANRSDKPGKLLNSFERRLTDVAKCLVGKPKLIMFDEPAGGLSVEETKHLGDLILGIHVQTGAQTLVIDHDVDFIARICAETLVLDFGKKIAFGSSSEVLASPKVKAAYLGIEEISL